MMNNSDNLGLLRNSRYDKRFYLSFLLILSIIAMINALQACFVFFKGAQTFANFMLFLISNLFYSWLFLLLPFIIEVLSKFAAYWKTKRGEWLLLHFFVLLVYVFFHQTVAFYVSKIILGAKFNETLNSIWLKNPNVWVDVVGYFFFLLFLYLTESKERLRDEEMSRSLLEIEVVESKLDELKGKLHPDFFFSTMRTILDMNRKGDNHNAYQLLSLFCDFLRKIIYEKESDESCLRDEISFVQQYAEIESYNLNSIFGLEIDMAPDLEYALIPNLLLQPLIEELIHTVKDSAGKINGMRIGAAKAELQLHIGITIFMIHDDNALKSLPAINLDVYKLRLDRLYKGRNNIRLCHEKDTRRIELEIPYHLLYLEKENIFEISK